jgi:hypothetical protein
MTMAFTRLRRVELDLKPREHCASSATIAEDGTLVLELHDWTSDYEPAARREYAEQVLVAAADKDQLLLRLIAERFEDFEAAASWVRGHGIPHSQRTDNWA